MFKKHLHQRYQPRLKSTSVLHSGAEALRCRTASKKLNDFKQLGSRTQRMHSVALGAIVV
jgi:hypothetical protein